MAEIDVDKFMTALRASKEEDVQIERPSFDVQYAKLAELFASYQDRHTFTPGDRVAMKPGLGVLNEDARGTVALMFWRYLDLTDAQDQMIIASHKEIIAQQAEGRVDCVVSHICDDGHCLISIAVDSYTLTSAS